VKTAQICINVFLGVVIILVGYRSLAAMRGVVGGRYGMFGGSVLYGVFACGSLVFAGAVFNLVLRRCIKRREQRVRASERHSLEQRDPPIVLQPHSPERQASPVVLTPLFPERQELTVVPKEEELDGKAS